MRQLWETVASFDTASGAAARRTPGVMLSAANAAGMLLLAVTAANSFQHGWMVHFVENSTTILLLVGVFIANGRGRFVLANVYMNLVVSAHLMVESLMFGRGVRTHDYFTAMTMATLAFFPRGQRRALIGTLASIGLLWGATMLLLGRTQPLYQLTSAEIEEFRFGNVTGFHLLLVVAGYFLRKHQTAAEQRLEEEHARADKLLHDILPAPIVEQLKEAPAAIAQAHRSVTILFADIVDFTQLSAKLSPEQVVDLLNDVFTRFDAIAERHGLEKIKTIGDAYMAAAGVPMPREDHAAAAAAMALEMQEAARCVQTPLGVGVRLRIGINTGPVVAGVIGTSKFIYDLWGDAVNTASRMESHGYPDSIQVTASVREALEGTFVFTPRGLVDVKGKGPMATWMLIARRESADSPMDIATAAPTSLRAE